MLHQFSVIAIFFILIGAYNHASAAGNATSASNAVTKFVKGLQEGKCTSLYDMVSHYDQMASMEKQMKPKAIWPQIEKKYRQEWNERCQDFAKDISKHNGSFGNVNNFIYVTPKTRWNIIETRPSNVGGFWDVFVKMNYTKQDAPCESKDYGEDSRLLKSRIYEFSVWPTKGRVFVDPQYNERFEEAFEFYSDSCKKQQDD